MRVLLTHILLPLIKEPPLINLAMLIEILKFIKLVILKFNHLMVVLGVMLELLSINQAILNHNRVRAIKQHLILLLLTKIQAINPINQDNNNNNNNKLIWAEDLIQQQEESLISNLLHNHILLGLQYNLLLKEADLEVVRFRDLGLLVE